MVCKTSLLTITLRDASHLKMFKRNSLSKIRVYFCQIKPNFIEKNLQQCIHLINFVYFGTRRESIDTQNRIHQNGLIIDWVLDKTVRIIKILGGGQRVVFYENSIENSFGKNTKVKVRSSNGDTDYFDIVAGVQQGDTLVPYLFIICLDYVLRTSVDKMKNNGFKLQKIPRTNNYGRRLRQWHSASGKYTRPSWNPAT